MHKIVSVLAAFSVILPPVLLREVWKVLILLVGDS